MPGVLNSGGAGLQACEARLKPCPTDDEAASRAKGPSRNRHSHAVTALTRVTLRDTIDRSAQAGITGT